MSSSTRQPRARARARARAREESDPEDLPGGGARPKDKRRRKQREEGSRSRSTSPGSEDEDSSRWRWESGMVMRVELSDFLCHRALEYCPRPGLNFLSGVNGSGKSAVLSAVVFALGGAARQSRRGASNKALVRHGAQTATARITLHNDGDGAYRKHVFGTKMTVCRSVGKGGGGAYKLLTADGKALGQAAFSAGCASVRQELTAILSHFRIQVDNPLTLLPQDLAKAFLSECDSGQLYGFYLRATQLDECNEAIDKAGEEENRAQILYGDKLDALPMLSKLKNQWEKKKELHTNLEDRRSRLLERKRELQWALVGREEARWQKKAGQRREVEGKVKHINDKIESCLAAAKAKGDEKQRVEKENEDLASAEPQDGSNEYDMKRELSSKKIAVRHAKETLSSLENKIAEQGLKLQRLDQDIKRDKEKEGEQAEECQARARAILELEAKTKKEGDMLASKETHRFNLENDIETDRDLEEARNETNALKSQLSTKKRELDQLRRGGGNRLVLLGGAMQKLVNAISKAKASFKRTPIGPIGVEVELAAGVNDQQAALVEKEIKNLLSSFIVDNFADRNTLEKLQTSCGSQFPVIVMEFGDGKRYDIEAGRCRSSKYPCLYDLLVVENPIVANCLVDQARIEGVLLIPNDEQAQELLKNESSVPKNCYYALTHTFNQLYPAPNYRSYAQQKSVAKVLHRNMDEVIKVLEQDIDDLGLKHSSAEESVKKARDRLQQTKDELHKSKAVCNEGKKKIRLLNEKLSLLRNEAEAAKPVELEVLEDELQAVRETKEQLGEQLTEARLVLEAATSKATAVEEGLRELQTRRNELQAKAEPLQAKIESLEKEIADVEAKRGQLMDRKGKYLPILRTLGEEEQRQAEKSEKMRTDLEECADGKFGRPDSVRAPEKIHKEIANLELFLQAQEEQVEPFELVMRNLHETSDKYKNVKISLGCLKRHLKGLALMVKRRRDGYVYIRNSMTRRIQLTFSAKLTRRGFAGGVDLNHDALQLVLSVCPAGTEHLPRRDMRTLSGGEKSYATIALILSLWECMQPPFRILDEFDVFMDMVNRKVALQQILEYAKESRRFQYIFLTPLSTDHVAKDKECYVVKLQKSEG